MDDDRELAAGVRDARPDPDGPVNGAEIDGPPSLRPA